VYVIYVSEVATLAGYNRFEQPSKVVEKVLSRNVSTTRNSFATEREFIVNKVHFLLRGQSVPEQNGCPVLIRVKKQMSNRMWDTDRAQCQALCFLYRAEACIFTERPESGNANPFTLQVKADVDAWDKLKQNMHDNLLLAPSAGTGMDFVPNVD